MNRELKFLFFIEREFHIVLLLPLINYLYNNNIGRLALYNLSPEQNEHGISNYGLRSNVLKNYLDFDIEQINNPYSFAPDITFMADFSYHYVEGLGKIVNIGHGTISKGWYYSTEQISSRENSADLLCVPGILHKEILENQVHIPILVSGMPKLDQLFANNYNKSDILNKMQLNPENKTVLLAPTFNDEFSLLPYLNEPIRNYVPEYLNLIIKLHGVSSESIKKTYKNLSIYNQNIYFCEDYDISECFAVADVLISDLSSVIYEFLATYKPVILFDSPKQKDYLNFNENDIEYLYRNIGARFSDPKKLPELLFRTLTKPEISDDIKTIADKFISVKNGKSSELIINSAISLLQNKKPELTHILILDDNHENTLELIKKYICRYNISVIGNHDYEGVNLIKNHNPLFTELIQISNSINEPYLLILHSDYLCSPLLPDFMTTHLKKEKHLNVYAPLLLNDEISYQQAKLRIHNKGEFDEYITGIQIGYSFAGQSLDIPFCESVCFAFNKTLLIDFKTKSDDDNENWFSFLAHLQNKKASIKLAFDCLIHKSLPKTLNHHKNKTNELANHDLINDYDEFSLKTKFKENPDELKNLINLLDYYYKNKQWDQIEALAELYTNNFITQWYLIRSLEEQKHLEKAFEKILNINLETINILSWKTKYLALKGKLLIKLNRSDEALIFIESALNIDNNDLDALLARAAYYMLKNELKLSLIDFNKVIEIDPENRTALIGIGIIYQFSYKFEEAEAKFLLVLEKNEEDLDALNGIVKCAWHTKSFDKAEKVLINYLELHPAKLDILFTLAGIYFEMKKYKEALANLETIFLFDEDFRGAKELYQRIKQIF